MTRANIPGRWKSFGCILTHADELHLDMQPISMTCTNAIWTCCSGQRFKFFFLKFSNVSFIWPDTPSNNNVNWIDQILFICWTILWFAGCHVIPPFAKARGYLPSKTCLNSADFCFHVGNTHQICTSWDYWYFPQILNIMYEKSVSLRLSLPAPNPAP